MAIVKKSVKKGVCPSCDRYIGAVFECPYCECEIPGNALIASLRVLAILFSAVGLSFYLFYARSAEPKILFADAIDIGMKYAYVLVRGKVEAKPTVTEAGGKADYIAFTIRDGTGSMRIIASGRVATKIKDEKKIPMRGQAVEVAGTVDFSLYGSPRILLTDSRMLKVRP